MATEEEEKAKKEAEAAKVAAEADLQKRIDEAVAEKLKPVKEKLDAAYGERDEAKKKVAEYEKQAQDAEIKRLQEEGKHKEAYEKQLAQERAAREAAEHRAVELTRDVELRRALSSLDFVSDKAVEAAFRELSPSLAKSDDNVWRSKDGKDVAGLVAAFASEQSNAFLFKPKQSSGSGGGNPLPGGASGGGGKTSLYAKPLAEVLEMAKEGTLPTQQR